MHRLCQCFLFAGFVAISSTALTAATATLTQRLQNAAESSSLDDPSLKPWHLRLSFQLFDPKGDPTEQGSMEEWWSGANDKRLYASPSYSATEIRRDKAIYRTTAQPSPSYLIELLRDEAVHPLAAASEVKDSVPDLRTETFGRVKLDCIMLDHPIKNVAFPPLGLFPTYCLDHDQDRLRVSFRYGSENVTRNRMGTFQGRSVAIDFTVAVDGVMVAKAHVESLAAMPDVEHRFDPDTSLELQNANAVKVGAGVIAGAIVSKVAPVYPDADKRNHTSGTVHLHAEIGTDGRIHRLTVLDAPSATLAVSALAAVRQWVYKPYLLNGLPTSVDTTITVNYALGPG